jgi:hypothetical protein
MKIKLVLTYLYEKEKHLGHYFSTEILRVSYNFF